MCLIFVDFLIILSLLVMQMEWFVMRLDATCGYKVMINDMRDAYWFVNIVYFFFFFFFLLKWEVVKLIFIEL